MVCRGTRAEFKQIFAGTTRIATKLEQFPSGEGYGTGAKNLTEVYQYFYHPDHLGSTGFATDATGEVYQHLEYFPFGETWVDEVSDDTRVPYRFTGQEFDEETKLYYYGARYYDPRTSVWESPDPAMGAYLHAGKPGFAAPTVGNNWNVALKGAGMGGAFEPHNLNGFGYTRQNPLRFVDPTGAWSETYTGVRGVKAHQLFFQWMEEHHPGRFTYDSALGIEGLGRPDVTETFEGIMGECRFMCLGYKPPNSYRIWELKPVTHKSSFPLIAKDFEQIGGYKEHMDSKGHYVEIGNPEAIVPYVKGGLYIGTITDYGLWENKTYDVKIWPGDPKKDFGRVFYELSNEKVEETNLSRALKWSWLFLPRREDQGRGCGCTAPAN